MPIDKIEPAAPPPVFPTAGVTREKNRNGKDSYVSASPTDPRRRLERMLLGSAGDVEDTPPAASAQTWIPLPRDKFDAIEPAHEWDFPAERGKEFASMDALNDFLVGGGVDASLNEKSLGQVVIETKGLNPDQAKAIVQSLEEKKKYPGLEDPKTPLDLSIFTAHFIQQHSSAHQEIKYYERLLSLERHFIVTGSGDKIPIQIGNDVKKIFTDRIEVVRKSVYKNYLKIAEALNKLDTEGNSQDKDLRDAELILQTGISDPIQALLKFLENKPLTLHGKQEAETVISEETKAANQRKIATAVREALKREWFAPTPAAMYSEQERSDIAKYKKFFMPNVLTELQLKRSALQKDWEASPKWKDFEEGLKKKQGEILTHVNDMLAQIAAGKEKFVPDLKILEQTPEAFAQAAVDHLVEETKLKEQAPEAPPPPQTIDTLRAELAAAEQKFKEETTEIEKIKLQLQISDLKRSIAAVAGEEASAEVAAPAEPPAAAPPPVTEAEPPAAEPPPPEEAQPSFSDLVPDEEVSTSSSQEETRHWYELSAGLALTVGSQSEVVTSPSSFSLDNRVFSEEARKYHERAAENLQEEGRKESSLFLGPMASATLSLYPTARWLGKYAHTAALLGNVKVGYLGGDTDSLLLHGQMGAGLQLGELLKTAPLFDLSGHLFFGRVESYRGAAKGNSGWEIFQAGGCLSFENFRGCVDWTRMNHLPLLMFSFEGPDLLSSRPDNPQNNQKKSD